MPIDFRCAVCKNQIRVPDDSGGKKTKCPKCNAIQKIPDGSAPSPPLPSAGGDFGVGNSDAGQSADIPGSVSASQGTSASGLGDDYWSQQSGAPAAPDSNNPFAADSDNPYASPQQTSAFAPRPHSSSREECRGRIMPPAIIVMVLVSLTLLATVVSVPFNIIAIMNGANNGPEMIGQLVGSIVSVGIQVLALFGLYNMMNLKNKALAWTGIILGMLPCGTSICCIIALPFAIWGIVVLADAEVSRNFES